MNLGSSACNSLWSNLSASSGSGLPSDFRAGRWQIFLLPKTCTVLVTHLTSSLPTVCLAVCSDLPSRDWLSGAKSSFCVSLASSRRFWRGFLCGHGQRERRHLAGQQEDPVPRSDLFLPHLGELPLICIPQGKEASTL